MKKRLGIGFAVLLAIWFVTSVFVVVGAGQVAVVTQFGRVTGRELSPGLSVKLPWPVQAVTIFDTRVQKEQSEVDAASLDLQEVQSTIALNYHLDRNKISVIYQTVGPEFTDRLIAPAVQEAFKATTAQYSASDLLLKRAEVKGNSRTQLEDRLGKYGIVVDDLSIVNFNFSDDFNKAIETKQVAQQQAEQAQYHLEQAQKDAQAQAAQKDSLTPEILQKMAIDKWDGHMPQYVGSGSVFNIPLTGAGK
jgi:prohibitin 1